MAFDEDRCRIRRGHGPDNFALLRKIAVNLLKAEKTCKRGIEGRRKHAARSHDYLLTVPKAEPASPSEVRPRLYGGFAPQSRRRSHRLGGRRDAASSGFRRHS
jgi:hypothetical protein